MQQIYIESIKPIIFESINSVQMRLDACIKLYSNNTEIKNTGLFESSILLEDEEMDFGGGDSGDSSDFGGDSGDAEGGGGDDFGGFGDDAGDGIEVEVSDKLSIQHIREGINTLMDISEYLDTISADDYSEINYNLYKLSNLFSNFIQNYTSYEDKDKSKIMLLFKRELIKLSDEISKII